MVQGSGERALFPTTSKCVKSQIAAQIISLPFVDGTKSTHPHKCLGSASDEWSTGATGASEQVRLIGEAGGCTVLDLIRGPRVAVATPSDCGCGP